MTDFLTAVQWLGTLAFAFVAIGFVESFTVSICKRIFLSDDFVKDIYQKCKDILPDSETFDNLKPTELAGSNTNDSIQSLKRDTERLLEKTDAAIKEKKNGFAKACQIKSLPSVSLFLLLTCSTFLIAGGLEKAFSNYMHNFTFLLSSLSILYIVLVWLIGDSTHTIKLFRFDSFRHSICSFIIFLFISFGLSFVSAFDAVASDVWFIVFTSFILIGFICFAILVIKIGFKVTRYKRDIENEEELLFRECQNVKTEVDKLLTVAEVAQALQDKSQVE